MRYLEIPQEVLERPDARELVRFWISGGKDFCTLQGELWDRDKEPMVWATVAADIMKHAILKLCLEDPSRDRVELLAKMKVEFEKRLAEINDSYSGRLGQ